MSIQYKNSFQSTLGMLLSTMYTAKCYFSTNADTLMILAWALARMKSKPI